MRVLVACEESQRVCISFRELGHEAYSCDIDVPSGGHPEWHILSDCLSIINGGGFKAMDGCEHIVSKWDIIIAHPPCTYISNAGACRLYKIIDGKTWVNRERLEKGLDAKDFFMQIYNADCDRICIENPVPSSVFRMPRYSQIIQPYEHGDPYLKRTCLWLKGLPPIIPTCKVEPVQSWVSGGNMKSDKKTMRKNKGMNFRDAKTKSKTFWGIARAMASQWGRRYE